MGSYAAWSCSGTHLAVVGDHLLHLRVGVELVHQLETHVSALSSPDALTARRPAEVRSRPATFTHHVVVRELSQEVLDLRGHALRSEGRKAVGWFSASMPLVMMILFRASRILFRHARPLLDSWNACPWIIAEHAECVVSEPHLFS